MVRIVGNDIPGEKKMIVGLTQIRGVGYMFANTILNVLKINPGQRIGYLSPEQIKSIENVIKNPSTSNFPSWFLNRRKDVETGEDKHLITSDIAFTVRNDNSFGPSFNSTRISALSGSNSDSRIFSLSFVASFDIIFVLAYKL